MDLLLHNLDNFMADASFWKQNSLIY